MDYIISISELAVTCTLGEDGLPCLTKLKVLQLKSAVLKVFPSSLKRLPGNFSLNNVASQDQM